MKKFTMLLFPCLVCPFIVKVKIILSSWDTEELLHILYNSVIILPVFMRSISNQLYSAMCGLNLGLHIYKANKCPTTELLLHWSKSWLQYLLCFPFCDKHHDQKQLHKERVCFSSQPQSFMKGSQCGNEHVKHSLLTRFFLFHAIVGYLCESQHAIHWGTLSRWFNSMAYAQITLSSLTYYNWSFITWITLTPN